MGAALVWAALPGSAHAADLVVGACYFDVDVTFTPALAAVPDHVEVGLDGSGTCHLVLPVTDSFEAGLQGGLDPVIALAPNLGCLGGVAVGDVELTMPDFTEHQLFSGRAHAVVTPVAAAIVVVSDELVPEFAAAGAFVHVPGVADATCATAGLGTTTWTGVVVFEDPTVV